VYEAKKILLFTPLLKWYLKFGLKVTQIHRRVSSVANPVFSKFKDWVTKIRTVADDDPSQWIQGLLVKLIGNSAVGKNLTNKNKHTRVFYVDSLAVATKHVNSPTFKDATEIKSGDKTIYEIQKFLAKIKQDMPMHIGVAVYQLAKMKMLDFYYNCIDKFLSRDDFQYLEMDTDSAYIALTGEFEDLIKPCMKEQFEKEKHLWFCTDETRRVPGLFKVEFLGWACVALTSKMYYVAGYGDEKFSCKGMIYV